MSVKALTLWQPWATLIALGEKQYETRGWVTPYRGPLVIHASKREVTRADLEAIWPVYQRVMARHGTPALPFGAAVCVVDLVDVIPVERLRAALSLQERAFGGYAPGRFAWKLAYVRVFEPPVAARGAQGLWDWTGALP